MAALRSLLFALVFYSWTVLAVLLVLPGQPVRHRRDSRAGRMAGCASIAGARATSSASAPGSKARRPTGPALVAVKHQSMYETMEIMLMLDEPAMVLKRELADIPLWGWVVRRYGVIPVDRAAGAAALRRMMRAAEAAIAEGRPIVIFSVPCSTPDISCRSCFAHSSASPQATGVNNHPVKRLGRSWPRSPRRQPAPCSCFYHPRSPMRWPS